MHTKLIFSDNTLWGLLNFRGGIIRHFLDRGYRVCLVAPNDNLASLAMIPEGATYIPIEMNRTGTGVAEDWRYYRRLKAIYRAERPDYIFHYTIKPNIYGTIAAHRLGIPSAAMIAGLGHVFSDDSVVNRIARAMYKVAMKYSDRVLVLNRYNYDLLCERKIVAKEKLLWLKGGEGVDLQRFTPQQPAQHERPVFLMIARLLYEKGFGEYIEAAKCLHTKAIFRVMGPIDSHPSAVKRADVEKYVRQGVIEYIEFTPEVIREMTDADCIVLPSYYNEGLSRVLMEACAIGRAVICSDIAGCREAVKPGENGFLCRPQDVASLIDTCSNFLKLSSDERVAMGVASRMRAEELFDENAVIAQYNRLPPPEK